MKKTLFALGTAFILVLLSGFVWYTYSTPDAPTLSESKKQEALQYCKANSFDTSLVVFVDFSIASGKQRFWAYDFQQEKAIVSSLCCHGMGMNSGEENPVFSNENGSYCSSLGKYKLGARSYSQYGIHVHYKMHGLEKTNSRAFERIVVLHSFDPVPSKEIYPLSLPLGWSLGCPVISNEAMTQMDELLKNRNKPVLLWIYH